jgi:signal peptidase II
MKKFNIKSLLLPLIALAIVGLDIYTKFLVVENLPLMQSVEVIGNFARFTFVYNTGITFGMFSRIDASFLPFILSITAMLALAVVFFFYFNIAKFIRDGRPQSWARVAIMFITGGAIGNNLLDRLFLFNKDGVMAVVDFIDIGIGVHRFYIFNVADSFIVIGSIMLAILFFFFEKKQKDKSTETDI